MASIFWLISSVALAVCLASSFTSLATTANPLPASPARAASMVALSASRFVCCAIEVMTLMTCPISVEESPSLDGSGGGFGDLDRGGCHSRSLGSVLGDFLDAGAHLFGPGGDGLKVLADRLRGLRNHVGLGRGFLGVGGDLLAGGIQFFAGAGYVHCIFGDGQDHAFQVA